MRVTKDVAEGEGRQAPDHGLRRRPARARVDHAGDGAPPARPRASTAYGTDDRDHRDRQHDRAVVRPGRQPRRLRLHVRRRASGSGARTSATTTATARSRRRRRRPQPQLPDPLGLRQRGLVAEPGQRDLPRPVAGSEPETQALDALFARHHAGVPRQLPLGRRAAAARHRLAGGDAVAGRRDLRGDGRRRREPGGPRLRPRHLGRAVHDQRRHRHAHAGGVRHARASRPRCRRARRPRLGDPTTSGSAEDCESGLRLPRRRGADPGRVREEHPVRAGRRRVGARPGRPGVGRRSRRRGLPRRHASRCPTAIRRPSRSWAKRALQAKTMHYSINGGKAVHGRPSRSGPAASATASRTTTTTPSTAAR